MMAVFYVVIKIQQNLGPVLFTNGDIVYGMPHFVHVLCLMLRWSLLDSAAAEME